MHPDTGTEFAPVTRPPNDRGQGRKPVKAGEKTVSVTFRFALSHVEKLERISAKAGVGRGDWVRDRIEKAKE
jgi:hypothetical protein